MKVIVAHPGQQHSFRVASALKKNGSLYKYMTSVYDIDTSLSMKIAHFLVRGKDVERISKRKNPDLSDEDVVTYYTFCSLLVIVFSRISKLKKMSYWLDRKIADHFGKKVAKYAIRHNVDAVICFSMNEKVCFNYLKKHAPNIKRIVDCANSPVYYMKNIYENDMAYAELKKEAPSFWNVNELAKQMAGLEATEFFLAPSHFVQRGLEYCGIQSDSIFVLPYGTNFEPQKEPQMIPDVVRFIYVGQVTHRKGMHYLLKAFSELEPFGVEIDIIGGWPSNSELYRMYKGFRNIRFHGNILHAQVREMLLQDNVFVFPSLSEGLSLSCLEAMSCGLPIICSVNSGANDFVQNGYNGFVIRPDDISALKEKILFFYNNPKEIVEFSKNTLNTIGEITWDTYSARINRLLHELVE